MAEFQVIYGRKDQPKENWRTHIVWDYSSNDGTPVSIDTWGNPQEANAICKKLNEGFKSSYGNRGLAAMLKRLPDPVDYITRETAREDYQPFEVQGTEFHCAELKENSISYFATVYDAYDNRRSTMKIGRYLHQFTKKDDKEIGEICARYGVTFGDAVVHFAKTRDEIRYVYETGPSSCMSDSADAYGAGIHPAEVYASGDFEVAYLMRDERITARTVVIPSKKVYINIYGDNTRMRELLQQLGYRPYEGYDDILGLKLLLLKGQGRVACPYFDFSGGVDFDPEDETKLIITRNGDSGGEEGYLESDLSYPEDDYEDDYY